VLAHADILRAASQTEAIDLLAAAKVEATANDPVRCPFRSQCRGVRRSS
jgi:hypothetical protein